MKCTLISELLLIELVIAHIPVPQPIFISLPQTIRPQENETITLSCTIENLGSNIVRWWKGDVLLADSSDTGLISPQRLTVWDNSTLEIQDVKPDDTGEYICQVVRQDPWNPIELVHTVQVLYPPQVFPLPPTGYLEVDVGDEVQIGCMATGVPTPVVTWRTKGETMQLIDNRHRLKFTADNRFMAGIYQCEANNGIGAPAVANIKLRILFKPIITADKTWIHSSPGVRSEIVCRVVGDPEPTVEWLYEGASIEFGSTRVVTQTHGEKHVLLFRDVRATDFGEYICRAVNIIATEEQTIQLSGVANQAVFKKDNTQTPAGDSYTLIWEVDSYSPIIEYNLLFREQTEEPAEEWIKLVIPADGHTPGPIHSKSYKFTGLKQATVYHIMLLSRNKFGWSKPSHVFKFATEGAEIETEMLVPEPTEVEDNLIPVEVKAIFKSQTSPTRNQGATTTTTNSLVLLMLSIINKHTTMFI